MAVHILSIPPLTTKDIERFWSKVSKIDPKECWLWNGKIIKNHRIYNPQTHSSYGQFKIDNRELGIRHFFMAHRISYFIHNGPLPDPKLFVLHSCDNPRCVNPHHLEIGDQKKNMGDASRKKRLFSRAKLTSMQVLAIREKYTPVRGSIISLAREFNVKGSVIAKVVHGETHKGLL